METQQNRSSVSLYSNMMNRVLRSNNNLADKIQKRGKNYDSSIVVREKKLVAMMKHKYPNNLS